MCGGCHTSLSLLQIESSAAAGKLASALGADEMRGGGARLRWEAAAARGRRHRWEEEERGGGRVREKDASSRKGCELARSFFAAQLFFFRSLLPFPPSPFFAAMLFFFRSLLPFRPRRTIHIHVDGAVVPSSPLILYKFNFKKQKV